MVCELGHFWMFASFYGNQMYCEYYFWNFCCSFNIFRICNYLQKYFSNTRIHVRNLSKLYKNIGLGALKYFLLKVEPKKRLLFDPAESIDFQGNTGPFIQYTHARIKSLLAKANFKSNVILSEVEGSGVEGSFQSL